MAGIITGQGGTKVPLARRFFQRNLVYLLDKKTDERLKLLRRRRPVYWLDGTNIVLVTRFDDVACCLDNSDVFRVVYGAMIEPAVGRFMLGHDDLNEGRRDRALLLTLMGRQDSELIGSIVEKAAMAQLAVLTNRSIIDLVPDYSRSVSAQLVQRYFGFQQASIEQLLSWSRATQHDIFHNRDSDPQIHQRSVEAGEQIRRYIQQQIDGRKQRGEVAQDDVLGRLIDYQGNGEIRLSDQWVVTNIAGMLVGAIETASFAVVNIMRELLDKPDVLQLGRQAAEANDKEKLLQICHELLRLRPINGLLVRQCVEDFVISDTDNNPITIPAGSKVLLSTRSAMRDESVVLAPEQFRLGRPKHHYFTYGSGSHHCFGDKIADILLIEMVKPLLLVKSIQQIHQPDFQGGPFPEQYLLSLKGR